MEHSPTPPQSPESLFAREPRFLDPLPEEQEAAWRQLMQALPGLVAIKPFVEIDNYSALHGIWEDEHLPTGIRDRALLYLIGNEKTRLALNPLARTSEMYGNSSRSVIKLGDPHKKQIWLDEALAYSDPPVVDDLTVYNFTLPAFFKGDITPQKLIERFDQIDVGRAQYLAHQNDEYPRECRLPVLPEILLYDQAPELKPWATDLLKAAIAHQSDPSIEVPGWLEQPNSWYFAQICHEQLRQAIKQKDEESFRDIWAYAKPLVTSEPTDKKLNVYSFSAYSYFKALEFIKEPGLRIEIARAALTTPREAALISTPHKIDVLVELARTSTDADLINRAEELQRKHLKEREKAEEVRAKVAQKTTEHNRQLAASRDNRERKVAAAMSALSAIKKFKEN